jgi:hypothetical protein
VKRLAAVALPALAVIASYIVNAQQASGQTTGTPTATATPTLTPTPTPAAPPTGADLINEMLQAIVAKNSFHAVATEKLSVPGQAHVKIQTVTDESLKPLRLHEVDTETGLGKVNGKNTTINIRLVDITVGKRSALRVGKGKWSCGKSQAANAATMMPIQAAQLFRKAVNLGAAIVRGTPVWHVHATLKLNVGSTTPSTGGGPLTLPVNFFIAQSDFTLLRETSTIKQRLGSGTLKETLREDITDYGETVSVKLPGACRAK